MSRILILPIVFILFIILLIASIIKILIANKSKQILISLDQLGSNILFNNEDLCISSLLYFYCEKHKKYCWYMKIVDTIALVFFKQKYHCKGSFENETKEFKEYTKIYNL